MKNPSLVLISDAPIPEDKQLTLTSALDGLRQGFQVSVIDAGQLPEAQLVQKIKAALPTLPIAQGKLRLLDAPPQDDNVKPLRQSGPSADPDAPVTPAEELIEAFQARFQDARFQIRQFEIEIVKMKQAGVTTQETRELAQKMEALANRQKAWIKALAGIIQDAGQSSTSPPPRSGKFGAVIKKPKDGV